MESGRASLILAILLPLIVLHAATASAQTAGGLVAAYAFDEGAGGVAADASGASNTGSISGATWTAGRFGGALAFDGAQSRVTTPEVTLGPAFTLMAWVSSPTPTPYETVLTVGSDRDLYLSNGVVTFWDGATERAFGGALSPDAWHHVALVYDGSTLNVYVDGLRQDAGLPGALGAVTGVLQVGAWRIEGYGSFDFFDGAIDEVRVYDRALTAGEVQRDMATPVSSPPPDVTPPSVALTAPADGTTASGAIVVAAEAADDVAVVGVQFLLDGVPLGDEVAAPAYAVTWDTTQAANGPHTLTAVARDAAGNAATSAPVSVTVDNAVPAPGYALRFFGNGVDDIDRVKIPIDMPARPADVGATDFTLEFWMRALAAENGSPACTAGDDYWIVGNIVFDRDVTYGGDHGDYGISLAGGRIAFGVHNGTAGAGICSARSVADGAWHHVAVTRAHATGQLRIFVDGALDAEGAGPPGDISYRDNRATTFPTDRYLVIGAEKADAGPAYPSYSGWIDEVRLSSVLRYTASFPRPSAPFVADADTVALYHFDEGAGDVIADTSGAPGGPSDGVRRLGGAPAGPAWVTDTPFAR